MNTNTAFSNVSESPLDTLKTLVQVVEDLVGYAQDAIAADADTDGALEVLDSARAGLWRALAQHVDGVRPEFPHYTESGRRAALTYDDGSPVQEHIELRNGSVATYRPRRDGDRAEFIELISAGTRPSLSIVPTVPESDV